MSDPFEVNIQNKYNQLHQAPRLKLEDRKSASYGEIVSSAMLRTIEMNDLDWGYITVEKQVRKMAPLCARMGHAVLLFTGSGTFRLSFFL